MRARERDLWERRGGTGGEFRAEIEFGSVAVGCWPVPSERETPVDEESQVSWACGWLGQGLTDGRKGRTRNRKEEDERKEKTDY
jgi:hypothetical protein